MKRFITFFALLALIVVPFTGVGRTDSARAEVVDQGIYGQERERVRLTQFLRDVIQAPALSFNSMASQQNFASIYEGENGRFAVLNFGAPDAPISDSSNAVLDGNIFTELDLEWIDLVPYKSSSSYWVPTRNDPGGAVARSFLRSPKRRLDREPNQ